MTLDDSPESLDALLGRKHMPATLEPTPGDMPAGMIDAARDLRDATDAGDHHKMAAALWNAHSIAHAALTGAGEPEDEED